MGIGFRLPGVPGCREKGGFWYSPAAKLVHDEAHKAAQRNSDGASSGTSSWASWASGKTPHRKTQRKVAQAQQRAAATAAARGHLSDGEVSDDTAKSVTFRMGGLAAGASSATAMDEDNLL